LIVNIALAALKFLAGLVGHSQAVVADSVHSLSDASTDVAVLIGARYWSAPADAGHPHGHRRIETLVTVSISVVLSVIAVGLAYNALLTMKYKHALPPGWIAFGAAALSIVVKELLYHWSVAAGTRIKSSAMVANAWHHRSDALSSVPAALAVVGARVHPAGAALDHAGAVVVSLIIFRAAWSIGWPAVRELVDASAPQEDRRRIAGVATATPGVKAVHAVRTRYVGSLLEVDLHIMVDGGMSVLDGHRVSEEVKQRLLSEGPDIADVVVHLEPADEPTRPF
jgi:cation diffusion facilitator family transporter